MVKKFIPVITDTLFFSFAAFLLSLILIVKRIKAPVSLILAAMISVLFSMAVFRFLLHRKNRAEQKIKEKEIAEYALFKLSFYKKSEIEELVEKALSNADKPVTKLKDLLYSVNEKKVYAVLAGADGATKTDVVKLYNRLKAEERGVILCLFADDETKKFCARFDGKITLICGEDFYALLKLNRALPTVYLPPKKKKTPFKLSVVLNKKRAVKYLLFGSVFAVMSFFVRYNAYYLVCGCLFLILSAVTVVFGKSKVNPD